MPIEMETRTVSPAVTVVAVTGTLHMGNQLSRLEETLKSLIGAGGRRIAVDLTGVEFIDSSALGVLVVSAGRMRSVEGQMRFAGANSRVMQTINVTHAFRVLDLSPNLEAALAELGGA